MNNLDWSMIRGLLFDLDGVFFVGDKLIPGAVETIHYLKSRVIPCRFTTNTTTRSLDTLLARLRAMGLPLERDEIFSAPQAAVRYLRAKGNPVCHLVMADDTKRDFAEFRQSESAPDVLVIGDIGEAWNYEVMERLFRLLMNGAEMVALHKGRYWQTEAGLQLDSGAFVAGLEHATGKSAIVTGKPAESFFQFASRELGVPAANTAMVGDDIVNDVAGAQQVGVAGVLVQTGKYREDLVAASGIRPDAVIKSVAELRTLV